MKNIILVMLLFGCNNQEHEKNNPVDSTEIKYRENQVKQIKNTQYDIQSANGMIKELKSQLKKYPDSEPVQFVVSGMLKKREKELILLNSKLDSLKSR